jgi:hypothetical protein
MDQPIIRVEENGVEYFTVVATGESGLSGRGMARSLGIGNSTFAYNIERIKKTVSSQSLPESLKPLWGKDFQCPVKYKRSIIYSANAWACLSEYFAFDAESPTKEAMLVFRSFAKIGAESFVQSKTGWLPAQYKAASASHAALDRILDVPDPWKKMYEKEFCDRVFSWFGAQFYWDFCYQWMTTEERCKLNVLNPDRKKRIHQFIEPETRDRLKPRVHELNALVGGSTSREDFLRSYQNLYGGGWQQPVPLST